LARIEALDPAKPMDGETDMAKTWVDLEHSQPELDVQQNILRETACKAAGPYVIQGFIYQGGVRSRYSGLMVNQYEKKNWPFGGRFGADRTHPAALAHDFLDEANCPGARGLSEEDRSDLREIRDSAGPGTDGSAASMVK
jgi:hypothetical protein